MSKAIKLTPEVLHKEYVEKGRSSCEIAEKYGTYSNHILRLLAKYGIPRRSRSESLENAIKSKRRAVWNRGKKQSATVKAKIGRSRAAKWAALPLDKRNALADKAKDAYSKMNSLQKERFRSAGVDAMREAAKVGSKLENYMLEFLQTKGYTLQFHRKHVLSNENLEVDMLVMDPKIGIEFDGKTHREVVFNSDGKGQERLQKTIERDLAKNGLLMSSGYHVIRIQDTGKFESEVRKKDLGEKLLKEIKRLSKLSKPQLVIIGDRNG